MKLELFRQIFEKCLNIKFYENPSSGGRVVPCGKTGGRTDMKKLIVVFRNFVNVSKNSQVSIFCINLSSSSDLSLAVLVTVLRDYWSSIIALHI
jgi:hypothetical protein